MKQALESLVTDMVDKGILFDEARTEFEREFINLVLRRSGGNQSKAAESLGMHRNTLGRKLAELQISAIACRPPGRAAAAKRTTSRDRLRIS